MTWIWRRWSVQEVDEEEVAEEAGEDQEAGVWSEEEEEEEELGRDTLSRRRSHGWGSAALH
jgi:hypothetical protein